MDHNEIFTQMEMAIEDISKKTKYPISAALIRVRDETYCKCVIYESNDIPRFFFLKLMELVKGYFQVKMFYDNDSEETRAYFVFRHDRYIPIFFSFKDSSFK